MARIFPGDDFLMPSLVVIVGLCWVRCGGVCGGGDYGISACFSHVCPPPLFIHGVDTATLIRFCRDFDGGVGGGALHVAMRRCWRGVELCVCVVGRWAAFLVWLC